MTTVPDAEKAAELANGLVAERLAACVQILPPMTSVYVWKGEVQRDSEHLLLIKTLPEKWEAVSEFITANHPYDIPEIVAIRSEHVTEPYRAWINGELN